MMNQGGSGLPVQGNPVYGNQGPVPTPGNVTPVGGGGMTLPPALRRQTGGSGSKNDNNSSGGMFGGGGTWG